jgi:uncharacterized peroxidase-related enzyme
MAYIREIPLDELSDKARELYETNQAQLGYIPNYLKAFAHRPEVLSAWGQLLGAIRGNMDQRRYELVTLAAAGALRSTYCLLAHSTALLLSRIFTEDEVGAIARDYRTAGLTPAEVAMMAFAEKVAREAHAVTAADVGELRRHGFADAEILDIVLAAAARCFFSKTLDGVGAEADAAFASLDVGLRALLAKGRPFTPSA